MTGIKRHTVRKTVESRYNVGISNLVRVPWKPMHDKGQMTAELLPYRTQSTDMDDMLQAADIAHQDQHGNHRMMIQSASLVTTNQRRLSVTMQPLGLKEETSTAKLNLNRAMRRSAYKAAVMNPIFGEAKDHSIHREILQSKGCLLSLLMFLDSDSNHFVTTSGTGKAGAKGTSGIAGQAPELREESGEEGRDTESVVESIQRSSRSRSFGQGLKMRLHPEDFAHHFRMEAMCLIAE